MNARRDPDLLIKAFLEDGVDELPVRSYDAVRAAIDTRQRVVIGPWREVQMTRFATFGVAAAALVLIVAAGMQFLPREGGVGKSPETTPTLAPTPAVGAAVTAVPTPSSGAALPALTEQYESSLNGIQISYPAGWTYEPATEFWNPDELGELNQSSAFADVIYKEQDDTPFIALASQPLGDKTAEQWTSDFLAKREGCEATQPHTIDGIEGVVTRCGEGGELGLHAVAVSDGRAFVVWLYRIDDKEYFEQILATVHLDPTAGQPLTERYTSLIHGITVSYPNGWLLQPATEPWSPADVGDLTQASPFADVIHERQDDSVFLALASQPLDGKTAKQWTRDFLATREGCEPTEPHTVDGIAGVVTICGDRGELGPHAVVVTEGRAFVLWLYRDSYMPYFEQILATVQLDPPAAR